MNKEPSKIENTVYWGLNKFANCVMVTLLWILFCIPIVTIGASSAAMYGTVYRVILHDRDTVWSNFWRTFRTYFKKTTVMWLILLAVIAFSVLGWMLTYGAMLQGSPMGMYNPLFFIPIVYVLVLGVYIFAYVIRFDTDIRHIMKTSATLAVINLHWSLLMFVLMIVAALCMVKYPITIFFVPGIVCVGYAWVLEKIFRKIMRPEDLQKELDREEQEHRDRM